MIALTFVNINESELLPTFLDHHARQGVDACVAMDMGSEDGSVDYLRSRTDLDIHLIDINPEQTRQAARRRDRMADYARTQLQADWIVHSDCDEYWTVADGRLSDYLSQLEPESHRAILVERRNHFASRSALNLTHHDDVFDPDSRPWMMWTCGEKYWDAFQIDPDVPWIDCRIGKKLVSHGSLTGDIRPGGHGIFGYDSPFNPPAEDVLVHHYPIRSYANFERKVRSIGEFLNANEIKFGDAFHWRVFWQAYQEGRLEAVYASCFPEPEEIARRQAAGEIRQSRL